MSRRRSSWADGPLLGFDLETTAPDPLEARIVTASLVLVEPGQRPAITGYLADPGVEIPAGAAAIHGITTEHVRAHGRPAAEVADIVAGELALHMHRGTPVVAFNASYDLTVTECELARYDLPSLASRLGGVVRNVIDPYVIDREVDKYRKGKRTLTAASGHYGVTLASAHDSSADALAAVRVALVIAQQYPDIRNTPIEDLHTAQVEWHSERQADFAAYLKREGKDASDVSGDWPLRPVPEGVGVS